MVCDLTIAADNAIFGQTGPKVVIILLAHMLFKELIVTIAELKTKFKQISGWKF